LSEREVETLHRLLGKVKQHINAAEAVL